MKAIVYHKFGPPEVLTRAEVPRPTPKGDELLVKVYATTVEVEDPDIRRSPGINGIRKPKRNVLGMEFSGIIDSVGSDVTRFKKGDEVYGNTGMKMGACAEYLCLKENAAISLKPKNCSFLEAASVTNGALTALHFLRDKVVIKQGQNILIIGASGTVGAAAVQLAIFNGAHVTAVCGTKNVNRIKELGAQIVIDYIQSGLGELKENQFDAIFDVYGKSDLNICKKLLKQKGIYATTVPSLAVAISSLFNSLKSGKKLKMGAAGLRSAGKKTKDLNYLKELIEAGKLKAVIDKVFPLDKTAEAHRYIEEGKKNGTIAIEVQKI